jgi:hypothetical protein
MTAPAEVSFRSFGLPKIGNTDAEWEDSAAHSEAGACFVVADGATSAYSAGLWSHLLTRGFLRERFAFDDREDLSRWLRRRAQEWHARTAIGDEDPYYLREAQARGSHATLLAVELVPERRWQAVAIGDSCLLHYRRGELISSFPITDPDAFGYTPDLVATDRDTSMLAQRASGRLRSGDVLVAATDAAAEWMIRYAGTDDDPAPVVLADDGDLLATVLAAREAGRLRNDDVAIVRAVIGTLTDEPVDTETGS